MAKEGELLNLCISGARAAQNADRHMKPKSSLQAGDTAFLRDDPAIKITVRGKSGCQATHTHWHFLLFVTGTSTLEWSI